MWRNIVETSYAYLKYIGSGRHVELQIQSLKYTIYKRKEHKYVNN